LRVTRERIAYLLDLLAWLRVNRRPEELPLVSSGYRAEVERMQGPDNRTRSLFPFCPWLTPCGAATMG
jgi:hypothetical protein